MITSSTVKFVNGSQYGHIHRGKCSTCKSPIPFYFWLVQFKVDGTYNHSAFCCSEECATLFLLRDGQDGSDS
jgi:hypothetical protein